MTDPDDLADPYEDPYDPLVELAELFKGDMRECFSDNLMARRRDFTLGDHETVGAYSYFIVTEAFADRVAKLLDKAIGSSTLRW